MQDSLLWDPASERGTKRPADESLDDQDRFTRRFDQLALKNVSPTSTQTNDRKAYVSQIRPAPDPATIKNEMEERMHVDETKDKVFIHDLDAEVAEIEAVEAQPQLIFIPDIERHLNAVPRPGFHRIAGSGEDDATDRQVVLYSESKSRVLQAEAEAVMKAAERKDIHERQSQSETAHGYGQEEYRVWQDPDAMDIG